MFMNSETIKKIERSARIDESMTKKIAHFFIVFLGIILDVVFKSSCFFDIIWVNL